MIYLEQGQKVLDKPELVVYEATGERNDTDMVICAEATNPGEPFCWLEAQYIAYGGLVYKISDDKELESEILKIDPESTINDVAADPIVSPDSVVEPVSEPVIEIKPSAAEPISDTVTSPTQSEVLQEVPDAVVGEPASTSTSPVVEPAIEPVIEEIVEPVVEPVMQPIVESIIEPAIEASPTSSVPEISFTKRKPKKIA